MGETTYLGNVRISVDAKPELVGTELTFTCYPYNGNGQKIEQKAKLQHDDDKGYFFELSLPVGDYSISGLPYNGLRAQVHPLKTTWKRNPVNTDWNNWSNWTDGSPWGCTNVVIPTGATKYPDLISGDEIIATISISNREQPYLIHNIWIIIMHTWKWKLLPESTT